MAECVCSERVTHAPHGGVSVCGCLFIFPLSQTPARSSVSTWQWLWMQPQLLWMAAPAESLPLDAGAALTTDDVGDGQSPIFPPHHIYLCLICLSMALSMYFFPPAYTIARESLFDPACPNIFLF